MLTSFRQGRVGEGGGWGVILACATSYYNSIVNLCQPNRKRKVDESNQVYNQPFATKEPESTVNILYNLDDADLRDVSY